MVQSRVKYASDVEHILIELAHGDQAQRRLFESLQKAFLRLENDAFAGVQIPRNRIPRELRMHPNIWKYNLIAGWRLIYTVTSDDTGAVTIVIRWLSHDKYERLFNY